MIPTIRLRDANRYPLGEVEKFGEFKAVLRYNGTDTWTMNNMVAPEFFDRDSARGLLLQLDDQIALNGPIWNYDLSDAASSGETWDLAGLSDDFWTEARLCLPVPAGPPYTASSHDFVTAPAETFMHTYLSHNLGPSATLPRQLPGLVMATDLGRGTGTVAGSARFDPLAYVLNFGSIINQSNGGTPMGWHIYQDEADLIFEVYVPVDRSDLVKFMGTFGNLDGWKYKETGPKANYVVVGGQGELTARTFVEGGDPASMNTWGRVEVFSDYTNSSDFTELAQKAYEVLYEGRGTLKLEIFPMDTEDAPQFMTDYFLGDTVAVNVGGIQITDIVREVEITINSTGAVMVKPKIGYWDESGPVGLFQKYKELKRRVNTLEQR